MTERFVVDRNFNELPRCKVKKIRKVIPYKDYRIVECGCGGELRLIYLFDSDHCILRQCNKCKSVDIEHVRHWNGDYRIHICERCFYQNSIHKDADMRKWKCKNCRAKHKYWSIVRD